MMTLEPEIPIENLSQGEVPSWDLVFLKESLSLYKASRNRFAALGFGRRISTTPPSSRAENRIRRYLETVMRR